MNVSDAMPVIKGHWKIEVYDGDVQSPDTLIDTIEGENVILTTGKNLLLDRLFAASGFGGAVNSMGIGNSATAAAATDTQLLGSSPAPFFQALDSTPTRAGLVMTCVSTFGTGVANQNWQELALANATTNVSGTLFNRISPIGPFNKTSAVSIVLTATITQA